MATTIAPAIEKKLTTEKFGKLIAAVREMGPAYEYDVEDVEYQRQGAPTSPWPDRIFLMRIYKPRGTGPFPTLLDFHGGAWHGGDRTGDAPVDEALAMAGCLVMSPDFRQSHDAPHPAALMDTNLAIRWAKKHAEEYGGRTNIGATGQSTGGWIVMMNAMRPTHPQYSYLKLPDDVDKDGRKIDATLHYCIPLWSVLDPLGRYEMALKKRPHIGYYSTDYMQTREQMIEASPTHILERREHSWLPPALVIHGTHDSALSPEQVQRFVDAYPGNGGYVKYKLYDGMAHGFVQNNPDAPAAAAALKEIIAFIREWGQDAPQGIR